MGIVSSAGADMRGQSRKDDTENDGRQDKRGIPRDRPREVHGRHSRVMHRADSDTNYRSAGNGLLPGAARAGEPKPHCREDGDQQRCESEERVVTDRERSGAKGEHGDEMRRPNAAAGGEAGEKNPTILSNTVGLGSKSMNVESGRNRQHTYANGEKDEAVIVLISQTGQYA
jgi:hypothetical protein